MDGVGHDANSIQIYFSLLQNHMLNMDRLMILLFLDWISPFAQYQQRRLSKSYFQAGKICTSPLSPSYKSYFQYSAIIFRQSRKTRLHMCYKKSLFSAAPHSKEDTVRLQWECLQVLYHNRGYC